MPFVGSNVPFVSANIFLTATNTLLTVVHMWQSRVEIEGYSVAYFDRITAFKAPYR